MGQELVEAQRGWIPNRLWWPEAPAATRAQGVSSRESLVVLVPALVAVLAMTWGLGIVPVEAGLVRLPSFSGLFVACFLALAFPLRVSTFFFPFLGGFLGVRHKSRRSGLADHFVVEVACTSPRTTTLALKSNANLGLLGMMERAFLTELAPGGNVRDADLTSFDVGG